MSVPAPNSPDQLRALPRIVSAENDVLIDSAGRRLIDLFSGNGAALLGHANDKINAAITRQLNSVWIVGGLPSSTLDSANTALAALLPPTHAPAHFYSTGMEVAEFAMRLARSHTRRNDFIGFEGCMHGKSAATAPLGWSNATPLPHIHRLPSIATMSEQHVLAEVSRTLAHHPIAAIFIEPILGSFGGHVASRDFCNQLMSLAHSRGSLVIFDEILTGFHRTGPLFFSSELATPPDILLLGKALANGFPASAVVVRRDMPVLPEMLPGSTYANNPLAAAAIAATLEQIASLDLTARVTSIADIVGSSLANIPGTTLRGRGALWLLELIPPRSAAAIAATLYQRGIFINYTGNFLRLLPAATISSQNLHRACTSLREVLLENAHA